MKNRFRSLAFVILLAISVLSCVKLISTPIGKIIENPRAYAGKSVTITGTVTESFSLFVLRYFSLRDETGEIIVITNKPLPKKGTTLTVRGRVEEAFSIGDQQLIVLLEDEIKQ